MHWYSWLGTRQHREIFIRPPKPKNGLVTYRSFLVISVECTICLTNPMFLIVCELSTKKVAGFKL